MTLFSRLPALAVLLGCAGFLWIQASGPAYAGKTSHGAGMDMEVMNAASPDFDRNAALEISQAAVGRMTGNYRFKDSRGGEVSLSSLRGRPVFVSLIYSSCAHTCPMLTQTLGEAAEEAWDAVGEDSFSVVSIGFDVRNDTPSRMKSFALKQGINDPRWHFLSADQETINALSQELGFLFFPSAKGFDHLAQTTLLDADGRVATQIYGQGLNAQQLVEPLKHLSFGGAPYPSSLSNWIDNVRLFCTVYDPASGRYKFDYSVIMGGIIGVASLILVLAFLVHIIRHARPSGARGS